PEAHYDDLAGLDLHGKIAVYVNSAGTVEASGNLKSHYSSGVERWTALRNAGAIGVATIANPRTAGTLGTQGDNADGGAAGGGNAGRGAGNAGRGAGGGGRGPAQPTMVLADASLQEMAGQKLSMTITVRGGEKFFAGSGHTFKEIEDLARENKPLPHFPLA